jgi:hypothetical protein
VLDVLNVKDAGIVSHLEPDGPVLLIETAKTGASNQRACWTLFSMGSFP